jgi:hypothetical protein
MEMMMTMTMMVLVVDTRSTTIRRRHPSDLVVVQHHNIHFSTKQSITAVVPKMKILHSLLACSTPFLLLLHVTTTTTVSGSSSSTEAVLKWQARGVNPGSGMHGMVSFARTCFYE